VTKVSTGTSSPAYCNVELETWLSFIVDTNYHT